MPNPTDLIIHGLMLSQGLLQRYTADLTPPEYLHRPTEKSNCAAWTIGHLTLTDRQALAKFGAELPPLPEGYEHRFSREEGCPQAGEFGDVGQLMPLFVEHRSRLIDTVRRADAERLDQPLERPRPPMFTTLGELANFMAVHTSMHAGQLTTIRRSLGRPPIM